MEAIKIEKCEIKYSCPLIWQDLIRTSDKNIRSCTMCNKSVYFVTNMHQLEKHRNERHCIAFNIKSDENQINDIEDLYMKIQEFDDNIKTSTKYEKDFNKEIMLGNIDVVCESSMRDLDVDIYQYKKTKKSRNCKKYSIICFMILFLTIIIIVFGALFIFFIINK